MIVTGLIGYACAKATADATASTIAPRTTVIQRLAVFMLSSSWQCEKDRIRKFTTITIGFGPADFARRRRGAATPASALR
jgi:hypothetical protein